MALELLNDITVLEWYFSESYLLNQLYKPMFTCMDNTRNRSCIQSLIDQLDYPVVVVVVVVVVEVKTCGLNETSDKIWSGLGSLEWPNDQIN